MVGDRIAAALWGAASRNFSIFLAAFLCSCQTDEMKRSFFEAANVSILLYGCTTWTLTKRLEKKLDGNMYIFTENNSYMAKSESNYIS